MMVESHYTFPRYLAAKKTVDDRALNQHVWQALLGALPARLLRVLEIGAGIGTMVERMVDWGGLRQAEYTALDALPENIAAARQRLSAWGGVRCTDPARLDLHGPRGQVQVRLETADVLDFIPRQTGGECWDLLIAHAFLDLMDVPSLLPGLFRLLEPGGLFYFTLNFDGVTALEPALDPAFDDRIERLYHQTMDERRSAGQASGDSRAGRHLFAHLRRAGATVLAAGASDWVALAGPDGAYPADEAYFLHFIVHTMQQALAGHSQLDPDRFAAWIDQRHAQIERGELVYIAHQLDFVGRVGEN